MMDATKQRHKALIDAAIADGRLVEASRESWARVLAAAPVAAERELASLARVLDYADRTPAAELPWFPQFAGVERVVS